METALAAVLTESTPRSTGICSLPRRGKYTTMAPGIVVDIIVWDTISSRQLASGTFNSTPLMRWPPWARVSSGVSISSLYINLTAIQTVRSSRQRSRQRKHYEREDWERRNQLHQDRGAAITDARYRAIGSLCR